MKLSMKLKELKKNNKGSALIMVIIAMAFVGVLAAIIMYMSMMNYMMKATDKKTTDNFYSSETVLEQMLVGLQAEASDAINHSYTEIMQNYSAYSAKDRQDMFSNLYIDDLRNTLKGGAVDEYSVALLKTYVDPIFFTGGYVDDTVLNSGTHKMVVYADHILLKDICVKFFDAATGSTSIITTDFCLDVPSMNFTQSSEMPELFDYSLVANDTLVGVDNITAEIEGNVYGGKNGINIGTADKFTIKNAEYVITNSTISLNGVGTGGNAASLTIHGTEKMPKIWASNIDINGGKLTVSGQTYVADDLTIGGSGGTAKLEREYYGYGTALDAADKSSAIVFNSKDSVLDISDLDKILIGGHAYVGTKTAATVETNQDASGTKLVTDAQSSGNSDIMMGESIAMKGDQIAYLVPSQLIGVEVKADGETTTLVGKNPMKSTDYTRLLQYIEDYSTSATASFQEVATGMHASQVGNTLDYYGATYKKIFAPSNGETLVYYYLVMDEANANRYFQDYYGIAQNKEKLDKYYNFYVDGIDTKSNYGDYARINIQSNWLVDDGAGSVSLNRPSPTESSELSIENTDYSDIFRALKCKLVTNYTMLSSEEKLKDVFQNVVLRDKLTTYTSGGTKTFTDSGSSLKAILSSADIIYNGDPGVRLIVTTGNVTVNADYSGLIIAEGKITINHNAKIVPNKADLTKVLQYTDPADDTIKPITFFVNGSTYVLDGTSVSANDAEKDDKIILSDIVRYQNWTKQ